MSRYRIGHNAIYLFLSKISYICTSFILYILLVRIFDRNEINIYALAIAFSNLFILAVDFGVTEVAIRSSAGRFRENLWTVLISGVLLKCAYSLVWFPTLYVVVPIIYHDILIQNAIYIACLSALFRSFSEYIEGIAIGIGKSDLVAGFTFIQYFLLFIVCTIVALMVTGGLIPILYSYVAVMSLSLLMRAAWICVYLRAKRLTSELWPLIILFFRESPKFGISVITVALTGSSLYLVIISLVEKVSNDLAVFNGAQKIIGVFLIIGGVIGRSLYAAASNSFASNKDTELEEHLQRATHILALISFGAFVTIVIMGPEIANFLYSGKLNGAGQIMRLLFISFPLTFFVFIPGAILPASNKQGIKTVIVVTVAIIGLPIVYYATILWDIEGTAFAYVLVSAIQCIFLIMAQIHFVGYLPSFKVLWKFALASIFMGIILYLARSTSLSIISVCFIGLISYIVILMFLKEDEIILKVSIIHALLQKLRAINMVSK